ncbi:hypothetical protein V6N12_050981 [Hibiscus sabdariffa]|uniref:Uncharacterized protein n=1 Tax=Hibiscus sabdariffa TaxID=183260 RepID=A0ABR2GDY9_9ROSI
MKPLLDYMVTFHDHVDSQFAEICNYADSHITLLCNYVSRLQSSVMMIPNMQSFVTILLRSLLSLKTGMIINMQSFVTMLILSLLSFETILILDLQKFVRK